MKDEIIKIINESKGTLLGIGLNDEKILDAIEDNDNIHTCYLLSNDTPKDKNFYFFKKGRNKVINIKKIKKYFKKKSLDIIICNYSIIKKFMNSFIYNSIYLNNKTLYIYSNENLEKELKKYQRYTNDVKIKKIDDMYLLTINNENTKNSIIKDTKYKIIDFWTNLIDNITDLLIN
jgi:ABC-type xylose transport system substrate-binding protein